MVSSIMEQIEKKSRKISKVVDSISRMVNWSVSGGNYIEKGMKKVTLYQCLGAENSSTMQNTDRGSSKH